MNIRERYEELEKQIISKYGMLSVMSRGREKDDEPCSVRTCYQQDVDRITHSKAFRRLMHKTQVFLAPTKDHYRTRLTHTLEVSQIARAISRGLCLNETLTEAIALGHDLGHTPFGHIGEEVLDSICENGFAHNEQSLRVVDYLEKENGLNLTFEVRDGILNHTGKGIPQTNEGKVVRLADRIAYINHDIDDAIRAVILSKDDIPKKYSEILGNKHSKRINTMILDIIENSKDGEIKMSEPVFTSTNGLREFMFEKVYMSQSVRKEEVKSKDLVKFLYNYFYKNKDMLPDEYLRRLEEDGLSRVVCDYIACMTDRYAINLFEEFFVPKQMF